MPETPSFVLHDGDGSTTDFSYPFTPLRPAHLKVAVDGVDTPRLIVSPGLVRITPAPPVGTDNIRVYRETPAEPIVAWNASAMISQTDLNDASKQALYLAQEAREKALAAVALAESIPAGPPGPPGASGSGTGDMVAATYDPNGHNTDVFARANHTGSQAISTITSLEATLNALSARDAGKASTEALEEAVDELETLISGKANSSHTHAQSDVTGLGTALSGKANTSHTHAQSDITGLATALSGINASLAGVVTSVVVSPSGSGPYVGSISASITGGVLTISYTRTGDGGGG